VAEGEWVVLRCTYSGTHRGVGCLPVDGGMLVGVQPTGRSFEVQHIHMFHLPNGMIDEHFANRDNVGMMRQLGLLPPPPLPPAVTPEERMLILDVAGEAIACVEVLNRDEVRQEIDAPMS